MSENLDQTNGAGSVAGMGMWQALRTGTATAIGTPTTVVYAENLSESAILAGIRAGHVFIDTDGTRTRSMTFTAKQGTHTAMMGDTIAAPQGTEIIFTLTVTDAAGMHAVLITDGKASPMPGVFNEGTETRTFSLASHGVPHTVRVEVRDNEGKLKLLGNPIYTQP